MATKQQQSGGDGLGSLAGMSKNQLYDIMNQMKTLIEQNEQQARNVLVNNPVLTKALFQAQIMLGMVQVNESSQQELSQPAQESAQQGQNPGVQAHSLSAKAGIQEQANVPQTQLPARKQQTRQSLPSMPSASVSPGTAVQVQSLPPHSLPSMQQSKGHPNMQGTPMLLPSSSQSHSVPLAPLHSAPQPPPNFQPQPPPVTQQQQSLNSSGTHHLPPQPPFPPQPRPPLVQPFQHQHQHQHRSQMGPHQGHQGFQQQPHGPAHQHHSQPPFSSGMKIPGTMGPSFSQGQPPLPSQPPPHTMYQVGGSHMGSDFNSQAGNSMQVDRPPWMPGLSDNSMGGNQFPGPPPLHGHMGPTSQPPRPPQMSQEAEKLILQQVMSLTPEQINLLAPEQALQVRQLQQLLRP